MMTRVWWCVAGSIAILAGTVMCTAPGKAGGESRAGINEQCMECHKTFRTEPISQIHAKRGQLCVDCHGLSRAHAVHGEEKAKPDVVFARDKIDAFCGDCHDPGHHPQRKAKRFMEQYQGHPGPNGRMITAQSVCTDCHGHHIMHEHTAPTAGG
jgi:predicted CXXCH cytochrome family protein